MFANLKLFAYKAMRRIAVHDRSHFLLMKICDLRPIKSKRDLQIFTQFAELDNRFGNNLEQFPGDWSERFSYWNASVCVAVVADAIVGRLWWIRDFVPAELNHSGPRETQLPILLPANSIFVFDVYVEPSFRGERLYLAMLSRVGQSLADVTSIENILITVDYGNRPAKRAAVRMGFVEIGCSLLFNFWKFSFARYPDSEVFPIRIGKYVGHRKRDRLQLESSSHKVSLSPSGQLENTK